MDHASRARDLVKKGRSQLEHINSRDLAYALVAMTEAPKDERKATVSTLIDDRYVQELVCETLCVILPVLQTLACVSLSASIRMFRCLHS